MITFDRDALDAELKRRKPELALRSDFTALRVSAYKQALADYRKQLVAENHKFARASTLALVTAPSTGTAKLNTNVGDCYEIALDADAEEVADNHIFIVQSSLLKHTPRMTLDEIVAGGTGETITAFFENKGKIVLYVKDATFTSPADVHYNYFRVFDGAPSTGATALDILSDNFSAIVDATLLYINLEVVQ